MSVLPVGFGASDSTVDTGDIGHSLRSRAAATAYLSKTLATPTSNTGWALSLWIKRGTLSTIQSVISAGDSDIRFDVTTDKLTFTKDAGVAATSTAVFRDPTSHFHLFIRSNGTNIKAYRNTEEILSYTGTIPDLNSAVAHTMGKYAGASSEYFDGHRSRIAFVDNGGALTPQDFITLNTEINEWVSKSQSAVKAVVDAGGTNSFMLDFDDATSLTTLGYDKSSKGNNWTLNNFSLTAGVMYDHMLDVPGNSFATLNPLQYNPALCLAGNLQFTTASTLCARGVPDLLSCGKSYFEYPSAGVNYMGWGVQGGGAVASASMGSVSAELWGVYNTGSMNTIYNGSSASLGIAPPAAGGVCCVAFDAATGKLWLGYAASGTSTPTWIGGGDPAAGTSPSTTVIITKPVFPHADIQGGGGSQTCTFNAGQYPATANSAFRGDTGGYFHCVPPTGFLALCQANLLEGGTVTVSGTFTGNASADGPFVWINGVPTTLTINGNAVTFGTHADKTAGGFKLRTSSASYNASGANTWTATILSNKENLFKYNNAQGNP